MIILDNCEHVVDASASLAASILHACPRLTILATSRRPLQIAGEMLWLVPPLSTPTPVRAAEGQRCDCTIPGKSARRTAELPTDRGQCHACG
jgi:predicted ATPase